MTFGKLEDGGDLSLIGIVTHQGAVAAGAQRQRQSIEEDRLAGTGFAGENAEPGLKSDVELIDQDDVANGESDEHVAAVAKPS